jgi:hypothetical protein
MYTVARHSGVEAPMSKPRLEFVCQKRPTKVSKETYYGTVARHSGVEAPMSKPRHEFVEHADWCREW